MEQMDIEFSIANNKKQKLINDISPMDIEFTKKIKQRKPEIIEPIGKNKNIEKSVEKLPNNDKIPAINDISIYIKKLLEPFILFLIHDFNTMLENGKIKCNDEKNEYWAKNFKIVIAGGEAINHWIRKNIAVFNTSDFDLRVVCDGSNHQSQYLHKRMMVIIECFCKSLSIALNEIIIRPIKTLNGEMSIKEILSLKGIFIKQFIVEYDGKNLYNIRYDYNVDKNIFTDETMDIDSNETIVDITPYHTNFLYYIGDTPYDQPTSVYEEYMMDAINQNEKALKDAYFKMIIEFTQIKSTRIYVLKLGYILWDTIRILNQNIRLSAENKEPQPKLGRYLKKYRTLIEVLNNLQDYISCDRAVEIIEQCAKPTYECNINKNKYGKAELIDFAINSGYFTEDNRTFLTDLDFTQLCKSFKEFA